MDGKLINIGFGSGGESTDEDDDLLDRISARFAEALRSRPKKRRPANTGYMKQIPPYVWLFKVYRGEGRHRNEAVHDPRHPGRGGG